MGVCYIDTPGSGSARKRGSIETRKHMLCLNQRMGVHQTCAQKEPPRMTPYIATRASVAALWWEIHPRRAAGLVANTNATHGAARRQNRILRRRAHVHRRKQTANPRGVVQQQHQGQCCCGVAFTRMVHDATCWAPHSAGDPISVDN